MRPAVILAALLSLPVASCDLLHDDDGRRDSVRLGESVELAIGESAVVRDTGVYITFEDVLSDERCPPDTPCMTGGLVVLDARVRLRAASPGTAPATADVGLLLNRVFVYRRVEFQLEGLEPWPTSLGEVIPKHRYRATIGTHAQTPG